MRGSAWILGFSLVTGWLGSSLHAQQIPAIWGDEPTRNRYFQTLAPALGTTASELAVLSGWDLPPDEVVVVYFLSSRAGVASDAVAAARARGRPFSEISSQFGVGAGAYHVPLRNEVDAGALSSALQRFGTTPSGGWSGLVLSDEQIVLLVNVRFLAVALGVPPERVAAVVRRREDLPEVVRRIAGRP